MALLQVRGTRQRVRVGQDRRAVRRFPGDAGSVLGLQRAAGNAGVSALLSTQAQPTDEPLRGAPELKVGASLHRATLHRAPASTPLEQSLDTSTVGLDVIPTDAGESVSAVPVGDQVVMASPVVIMSGVVKLAAGAKSAEPIEVGMVQDVISTDREAVYHDHDKSGAELFRDKLAFDNKLDQLPGAPSGAAPFYTQPATITAQQRDGHLSGTHDFPHFPRPKKHGDGVLTETAGADTFSVSLAARRGDDLVHLKTWSWHVPWDMAINEAGEGTGKPVTVTEGGAAPATLGGELANEAIMDPENRLLEMTLEGAESELKADRAGFLKKLDEYKAKDHDSYWNMVGALWHSSLQTKIHVVCEETPGLLTSNEFEVAVKGDATLTKSLDLDKGHGGDASFLFHMVFDPGKLAGAPPITVTIAGTDIEWAHPFDAKADVAVQPSRGGQYKVTATLE